MNSPAGYERMSVSLVISNSLAGPFVPFDDPEGLKTRKLGSEGQATGTRKQLK